MILVMVVIYSLIILLGIFGIGAVFGYTILRPIATTSRGSPLQTRFYICDFFTLTFLLSLPIVAVSAFRIGERDESILAGVIALILGSVSVYAWARGAITLSSIGVSNSLKRCIFLGVLLPVAIIGSAIGVPALIVATLSVPQMSIAVLLYWGVGILATPVIAVVGRTCTLWVISGDN